MVNTHLQSARAPLKVRAIVEFFGGPTALARELKRHGIVALSPDAIEAWVRRRHIPHRRRVDLEVLAKSQKKVFSLDKFKRATTAAATVKNVEA